jgi:phosphoribosylamine-glycine ligase
VVGAHRDTVYAAADAVRFQGKQFRTDIGVEVQAAVGALP